jgi:EAL domain-containing protein (putative c-di-GMP-specific phosphodiesterase class I)
MEENGLILPMTEIVLINALKNLRLWNEIYSPGFFVCVNIPTILLRDNLFIQLVKNQLNTSGISPANLHLEITESGMIQDFEITSKNIEELKAIGVRFSIDDFGTGYSSLSYLRRLSAHTLKIDRAFIADIETSSDGRSIVEAIVAIGQTLEMDIIAEGIENQKQLEILKAQNCNKAQGYLFSPPVEAQKITEFLISHPTFF